MTAIPPVAAACVWCRAPLDPGATSCARCGAPVDVAVSSSRSGWYELPPIKDMARIQFGQSRCQIEGSLIPVADINLAAGDSLYFGHHELLWKDVGVTLSAMPMRGGFKRMLAGLPVLMSTAQGPGHIAFSKDLAGEMIALPLDPGQAIDCREHVFLVASGSIGYDFFDPHVWFTTRSGNDTETHRPLGWFMDRFSATAQPGLVLIHSHGNAFVRQLGAGEHILVKPAALLYKDPAVTMMLHLEHPAGAPRWSSGYASRYVWLRMVGPGRVCVQSAYEHFEDPARPISSMAAGTRQDW